MSEEFNQILLAEDHGVSRQLLERTLVHWGFEVIAVPDGEAALRALEQETPPPIALLDWMIPQLTGPEICRRIRATRRAPYVYLMLLTARACRDDVAEGLDAGADDYVIKPFDPAELRARLKIAQRVVALERALAASLAETEALRQARDR
jgi:DNA-binding response OmpR family regulator